MQPLGLRYSIWKFGDFPQFDLKTVLPAAKAINLNPIFDRLLAFGTDHILGGLLKAWYMIVVIARRDQDRSVGMAHQTFHLTKFLPPPVHVVLHQFEFLWLVAATQVLVAEPTHDRQQSNCYYHHSCVITILPTMNPVWIELSLAALL